MLSASTVRLMVGSGTTRTITITIAMSIALTTTDTTITVALHDYDCDYGSITASTINVVAVAANIGTHAIQESGATIQSREATRAKWVFVFVSSLPSFIGGLGFRVFL